MFRRFGWIHEILKFMLSPGFMLWGGVSTRGLIPKDEPIFVEEFLQTCGLKRGDKKAMNSDRYMKMLEDIEEPTVKETFGDTTPVWQDDCATIHHSKKTLKFVETLFEERIPVEIQAKKLDEVYPVENVWGIFYEKLRFSKVRTLPGLREKICEIWRCINAEMCKRMIYSMPLRLKEVIKKKGHRIGKFDSKKLDDVIVKK